MSTSTTAGTIRDQQPLGAIQDRVPPRRYSFQAETIFNGATNSVPMNVDDEDDQTIEVVDRDAVFSNGKSSVPSYPINLDDDSMLTDDDRGFTKSSSGSRRQSNAVSTSQVNLSIPHTSPSSEEATTEVGKDAYQLPSDPNTRTGKLRNKYVMPDGTVVNGKGLGRGRPGIKRGPRKSALSNEIIGTPDADSIIPFTPSPITEATSVPAKRKRADSGQSQVKDELDEFSLSSRDSTPEYNPAASTQTRSGRQIQKPAPIVVPTPSSMKAPAKRTSLPQVVSSPSIKKHPKIKAKVYRGREQFALCEHCLRGNGPPGNVIVFCDACNKCWHQRCHEPRISKELIADATAEWFCADCDRILHGKKKTSKPPTKPSPQIVTASTPTPTQTINLNKTPTPISSSNTIPKPRYGLPYIPGMALTPTQRKQYLDSLSKDRLIEIVLRAADLAPNMPIFETPLHEPPQSSFYPSSSPFPFPTLPKSMRPVGTPGIPHASPPVAPQQHQSPPHHHQQHPTPVPVPTHLPGEPRPPILTTIPSTIPIYSHPTAGTPSKPNTAPPAATTDDDEGYYDDYDELALVYPKPGEGVYDLALPPESKDLGMMLEGPDSRTFSHWVKGRGEMKRDVDAWKG